MKKINKIQILLFLFLGITFISCETTDLDLLDDPNNITLDKADLNRYLTEIQLDFSSFMYSIGDNGSELTRIEYMFGRNYENNYQPVSSNGIWSLAYQAMFSDMKGAEAIAIELGENKHLGVMKILKAYTLMTLVDFYGDVPLSEATNPTEFPFPTVDPGASVYAAAIVLLNDGIELVSSSEGGAITNDFFYNNDFENWAKLGNTLKMAAYVNTRLVDGSAMSKFNSIVSSGNYISSNDADFEFQHGTSVINPNTRHNAYDADYTATGAGNYRANWIMNQMLQDNDPRLRYYFYRQTTCTPGNVDADGVPCEPNQQQITCSTTSRPQHYPPSMSYCSVANGYWGRDHGNAEGIPPDNFLRTVVGVYPAAGKFDDDDFASVNLDQGGQGAGIVPIMLSSWADLMRAEMALVSGNSGAAANHLQSAMQKSIDKVMGFISLDPDADSDFAPTGTDVSDYISGKINEFSNSGAETKWEILAQQQFVSHYGNGIEPYNMYRRTGYPKTLQFNIEPASGNFVRSFLYPSNEADTNSNIVQKPGVDVKVFWDNNPSSPGFPFAN